MQKDSPRLETVSSFKKYPLFRKKREREREREGERERESFSWDCRDKNFQKLTRVRILPLLEHMGFEFL